MVPLPAKKQKKKAAKNILEMRKNFLATFNFNQSVMQIK
jgi:hypothetical protein